MIIKYLLLIGVIVTIYFIFFKKTQVQDKKDVTKNKKSSDMVECANCKIFCSIDDSIVSGGKYYCSNECLKKG